MDEIELRIMEYLESRGMATSREIAKALGEDVSTITQYMNDLIELDIIGMYSEHGYKSFMLKERDDDEEGSLISFAGYSRPEKPPKAPEKAEGEPLRGCPVCDGFITSEDIFCPQCGFELEPEEETERQVQFFEEESPEESDQSLITPSPEPEMIPPPPPPPPMVVTAIEEPPKSPVMEAGPKRDRKGMINGLTNGLSNELRNIRTGLTNGITNGNGIVNGLGSRQSKFDKKGSTRRAVVSLVFFILLLLSPLLFNVVVVPEEGIRIDGEFSDWSEVAISLETAEEAPFNPDADLIGYSVTDTISELFFYIRTAGTLFQGEPSESGRAVDTAFIFIDTDQSPNSGYRIQGLGADFMIKIQGWQKEIISQNLYRYTSDTQSWDDWSKGRRVSAAAFGSELEVMVDFQGLDLRNGAKVQVLFILKSYDMYDDSSDTILSNEKGVLVVDQQGTAPGHISGDSNRLLRLELKTQDADITVSKMRFRRLGEGNDGDVEAVRFIEGGTHIAQGNLKNGIVEFTTNIRIQKGIPRTLYLEVDVGSSASAESSIGFRIEDRNDVILNRGAITLKSTNAADDRYDVGYLTSVPQGIKIDGAFADWDDIFSQVESQEPFSYQDLTCQRRNDIDSKPIENQNVDLSESRIAVGNQTASFYLSVEGSIMTGTVIPALPGSAPSESTSGPGPSQPPAPGTPEPPDGQEPEPPPPDPEPISPELLGEDTAFIFLDTDNNTNTGYRIQGDGRDIPASFGADWMIKITGKHGVAKSGDYSKFNGTDPEDWDWVPQGEVLFGNDGKQLETQIESSSIGYSIDKGLGVCIYIHDWNKGSEDYSNEKLQVRGVRSSPDDGDERSSRGGPGEPDGTSKTIIRLRAGTFDPLIGEPDLDPELTTDTSCGYYIMQFTGPILDSWKDEISFMGARFHGYITSHAFIIEADDLIIGDIENLSFVRWVGIYQPAYKVQKGLYPQGSGEVSLDIIVFKDMDGVSSQIKNLGGEIVSPSESKLRVIIPSEKLRDVLYLPDVEWVEHTPVYKSFNDIADDPERLNVNPVWGSPYYLNGSGQIVGVCDTGLDTGVNDATMHDDFEGRIVAIYDLVGGGGETAADKNSGHGTHVAGSVLGNGTMSSGQIKGMAYAAELVFQAVEDDQTGLLTGIPADLNTLFQQAYDDSARIHTNSWGADVDGEYNTDSQNVDEFTWGNRDMLILFSAGNEGTDSDSDGIVDLDSLNAPASAKNCISVGGSENLRSTGGLQISYGAAWPSDFPVDPLNSDLMSNNSNGMVAFSSRGATDDGRIKPDLIAPGTNVLSTRSSEASGTLWGVYDSYYVYSGGTSMSTPLVAGCAALVRQFYIDKEGHTNPQGALIKATLINGATDISGQYNESGPIPNLNEGWGRVNLTNSIYPASPRSMTYEDVTGGFTSSGQSHTYTYGVASGEPLKITLVWTDYPGTLSTGGLVNDLNLNVTAPDGTTYYYGNDFTDGWSDESHTFDDVNNVECVYIETPQSGTYTVTVIAENIADLGSESDQDYALVISGNFQFQDDVGVEALSVNKTQLRDTQAEIWATIKNYGTNDQTSSFDVRCVITGPGDIEVLNETRTINSLTSLSTVNLTWYYTPTIYGQFTVTVRTELASDDYNDNNASTATMTVPVILSKLVTMTGTDSNDLFGFNVTSGHLNDDGYRDVVVGAPGANNVYVFYGSSSLTGNIAAADADEILTGPDADSRFGWSVGVVDVTGDGFDEVIVGAPAYNMNQGRMYMYLSDPVGLIDTIPDLTITGGSSQDRFGNSVSGAGDVDGDNFEDILVGAPLNDTLDGTRTDAGMAYLFKGALDLIGNIDTKSADLNLSGESTGDLFGFSVSFADDVNGDTYDDFAVGAPGASKTYLYYGWEQIGLGGKEVVMFEDGFESGDFVVGGWTLSSPEPVVATDNPYSGIYAAGGSVAIFGPNLNTYYFQRIIDARGYKNIEVSYFVAVEDAGPGTISFSASYSIDGGDTWIDFEAPITDTNNNYIAKTWDLTGMIGVDNNPIFAIRFAGTFGGMSQGSANAFWVDDVNVTGFVIPGSAIVNVTLIGENTDDNFGWAVSSAGNVNGDSYDDLVIGAPDYRKEKGRAYVFFGSNTLAQEISASDADVKLEGASEGDKFGYSVGSADLGEDGYSDVLVGAPYNDTIDGSTTDAGAVYLYNGSTQMVPVMDAGNCTRYGEKSNDHFGWSVSDAGNINNDGYGDIVVGAPHYDTSLAADAGKAYVLTIIPEYTTVATPAVMCILIYFGIRWSSKKGKNRN